MKVNKFIGDNLDQITVSNKNTRNLPLIELESVDYIFEICILLSFLKIT